MATLSDILKSVGGITEQDAAEPTGSDLTTRIRYANDSLQEWGDAYKWEELKVSYPFTISADSTVSLALPSNFRKDESALYVYSTTSVYPDKYDLIDAKARFDKLSGDKYAYIMGSYPNKTLIVPIGLSSGASTLMDIGIFPSSLATLTDSVPLASAQYLVKRITSMVFESRGDSRYPVSRSEADRLLAQMVEQQNAQSGGQTNSIPRITNGFVIGED